MTAERDFALTPSLSTSSTTTQDRDYTGSPRHPAVMSDPGFTDPHADAGPTGLRLADTQTNRHRQRIGSVGFHRLDLFFPSIFLSHYLFSSYSMIFVYRLLIFAINFTAGKWCSLIKRHLFLLWTCQTVFILFCCWILLWLWFVCELCALLQHNERDCLRAGVSCFLGSSATQRLPRRLPELGSAP